MVAPMICNAQRGTGGYGVIPGSARGRPEPLDGRHSHRCGFPNNAIRFKVHECWDTRIITARSRNGFGKLVPADCMQPNDYWANDKICEYYYCCTSRSWKWDGHPQVDPVNFRRITSTYATLAVGSTLSNKAPTKVLITPRPSLRSADPRMLERHGLVIDGLALEYMLSRDLSPPVAPPHH
jgi:hypothetical protein